ncbi:hypothetical protein [Peptoniphilus sp. BV3C26]
MKRCNNEYSAIKVSKDKYIKSSRKGRKTKANDEIKDKIIEKLKKWE